MAQGCIIYRFGLQFHDTTWKKGGVRFGDMGIRSENSTFGYTVVRMSVWLSKHCQSVKQDVVLTSTTYTQVFL